ncbi:glycosyltransferase family 2 protein [Flavobacterium limnophilum]|uniref:glycosyltransferase family 2 protein n=1 Tax=Flavobacterium limnophilum TaxID=3003262 RepID=UPI002482D0D4|nr:glycosyltransferase family 2 protein [Flavobacterium limnophilum]
MNKPLVSVIVPCYNQAQFLDDALQSVLAQTYTNWECIIVNDGSPDDTEEVAKRWLAKDARFQYVYKENGGLSSARNAGLDFAKGAYIQFLDSDDYLVKTKLELSLEGLQEETDTIVISNFNMFSESINDLQNPFCNLKTENFNFRSLLFGWDYEFNIPIHCGFFRKKIFDDFRFPEDLKAKEDWIFWMVSFQVEPNVIFIDQSLAYYRIHKTSMTKDLKLMEAGSLLVINHLKKIVPPEYLTDYLCFALEKKQSQITNLKLSLANIKNSRGFLLLEKIKKNKVVNFLFNKLK